MQNRLCEYVCKNLPRARPGGASGFVLLLGFGNTEEVFKQSLGQLEDARALVASV